jgi:hypothetical protein
MNVYEYRSTPAMEFRQSSVRGSGEGLFAAKDINPNSFMREYTLQVVCHGSYSKIKQTEDDRMGYFQINKR